MILAEEERDVSTKAWGVPASFNVPKRASKSASASDDSASDDSDSD